ncbi:ABC transporter substrate-binding protein [Cyanosarcina cf. burmensis CCALA 770]|nr:ABC transporter substrate-binding protein [Cyanosarcina cf. burmensis CCALA 770]
MFRKVWLFLILFVVGTIAFTGCMTARQLEPGVVTITLSGWSNLNEKQLLQKVLRDFEAKHPRIKVKYDAIADEYMDVMKTRLIGETAADVFYLEAFAAPEIMRPGVLEPLNSYISKKFNLADFYPQFLQAFQKKQIIYGLPKDYSTLALFYNKKAFQSVGLSQPPQTWEQLRKYAKKLTVDRDRDGRVDRYGFALVPELARQVFIIEAFGGKLIDSNGEVAFAEPESLKGLQLLVDLYRLDKSAAQPSDVGTSSAGEMFGQERVAMAIDGPWLIPYLKETFPQLEYATAEVPTINQKKGTMAYTVAYVMNRKSKHKAAAWELISYLTGQEGMQAWTSQGSVFPTRRSVTDTLQADRNPLYSPFIAGAEYATIWQLNEDLPIILNNFNNQFVSAIIGQQSLVSAMTKAQKTANKEIALSK